MEAQRRVSYTPSKRLRMERAITPPICIPTRRTFLHRCKSNTDIESAACAAKVDDDVCLVCQPRARAATWNTAYTTTTEDSSPVRVNAPLSMISMSRRNVSVTLDNKAAANAAASAAAAATQCAHAAVRAAVTATLSVTRTENMVASFRSQHITNSGGSNGGNSGNALRLRFLQKVGVSAPKRVNNAGKRAPVLSVRITPAMCAPRHKCSTPRLSHLQPKGYEASSRIATRLTGQSCTQKEKTPNTTMQPGSLKTPRISLTLRHRLSLDSKGGTAVTIQSPRRRHSRRHSNLEAGLSLAPDTAPAFGRRRSKRCSVSGSSSPGERIRSGSRLRQWQGGWLHIRQQLRSRAGGHWASWSPTYCVLKGNVLECFSDDTMRFRTCRYQMRGAVCRCVDIRWTGHAHCLQIELPLTTYAELSSSALPVAGTLNVVHEDEDTDMCKARARHQADDEDFTGKLEHSTGREHEFKCVTRETVLFRARGEVECAEWLKTFRTASMPLSSNTLTQKQLQQRGRRRYAHSPRVVTADAKATRCNLDGALERLSPRSREQALVIECRVRAEIRALLMDGTSREGSLCAAFIHLIRERYQSDDCDSHGQDNSLAGVGVDEAFMLEPEVALHLLAELREFSAKMRCHIVSCAEWQERARAFEAGCGGLARELGDGGEELLSQLVYRQVEEVVFLPLHSIVYRALASLEHGVVNERANVERDDFGTRAPTTVLRAAILRERIRSLQMHVHSAEAGQNLFDIPHHIRSPSEWAQVVSLLDEIDSLSLPSDKINAIVGATMKVYELYEHEHAGAKANDITADELLPIMAFVVARSSLRDVLLLQMLGSELCDPRLMLGATGYCLTSFSAAVDLCLDVQQRIHGHIQTAMSRTETTVGAETNSESVTDQVVSVVTRVSRTLSLPSWTADTFDDVAPSCGGNFAQHNESDRKDSTIRQASESRVKRQNSAPPNLQACRSSTPVCVDHNECHAVDEKPAGKLDSSDKFAKSVTEEARKRFRARHKSKFDFEFDVNNKLMGFEFIWPGAQVVERLRTWSGYSRDTSAGREDVDWSQGYGLVELMALPDDWDDEAPVAPITGFICPQCMQPQASMEALLAHDAVCCAHRQNTTKSLTDSESSSESDFALDGGLMCGEMESTTRSRQATATETPERSPLHATAVAPEGILRWGWRVMSHAVQSAPGSPKAPGIRRGVSLVHMNAVQGTRKCSPSVSTDWCEPSSSLPLHDCTHETALPTQSEVIEMKVCDRVSPCDRQQPNIPMPVPMPAQANGHFVGRYHCSSRPRPRLALPKQASATQRDMHLDFPQAVASPRCATLLHSHRNKPQWRRVPSQESHSPATLQPRPQKLSEDEYAF